MTDWTDLPWRTMRDDTSVDVAKATIDKIAFVLDEVQHDAWHEGDPAGGALSCWTATDEDGNGVEIAADLIVDHPMGGLCRIALDIDHAGVTRIARIVCEPDLVGHLLDDPCGMISTISRLLQKAIGTTDCMPSARPPRMKHAGLNAEAARMLVEEAARCGMDPSAPMSIETWGPCPLSRSVIRITGSGFQRIETIADDGTMPDDVPSPVKLSAHVDGSVRLGPLINTVESEGFGPMDLLQIHRGIAEGVEA